MIGLVSKIIDYESGQMSEEETISFFQELYDKGTWKSLQGSYQRTMFDLLESGLVS